eukprot:TRINITY_DN3903_c0_g1_i1.p1 TRINITY_DN3903_c0_g1~~TRINITY_DN3903_c0_g1_i1.p1  ORF type:complete len:1014 (-),score=195.59 TRINITY_DN3903_c0_g1_i1:223-3264(-)
MHGAPQRTAWDPLHSTFEPEPFLPSVVTSRLSNSNDRVGIDALAPHDDAVIYTNNRSPSRSPIGSYSSSFLLSQPPQQFSATSATSPSSGATASRTHSGQRLDAPANTRAAQHGVIGSPRSPRTPPTSGGMPAPLRSHSPSPFQIPDDDEDDQFELELPEGLRELASPRLSPSPPQLGYTNHHIITPHPIHTPTIVLPTLHVQEAEEETVYIPTQPAQSHAQRETEQSFNSFGEHPSGEHPSRTLFVRNIHSSVDDEELRILFGTIGPVTLPIRSMYTQCKHRGFVMISYYDLRDAQAAKDHLQGQPVHGRPLDIHYSIPKDNPSEKDQNQGTLVVFNLPPSITNEELTMVFSDYGDVKEIRHTPNKKHHRFIEFFDIRHAEKAMKALNKTEIKGKKIKIEPSRTISSPSSSLRKIGVQLSPPGTLNGINTGAVSSNTNNIASNNGPVLQQQHSNGMSSGVIHGFDPREDDLQHPLLPPSSLSTSPHFAHSLGGSPYGGSMYTSPSASLGSSGSTSPMHHQHHLHQMQQQQHQHQQQQQLQHLQQQQLHPQHSPYLSLDFGQQQHPLAHLSSHATSFNELHNQGTDFSSRNGAMGSVGGNSTVNRYGYGSAPPTVSRFPRSPHSPTNIMPTSPIDPSIWGMPRYGAMSPTGLSPATSPKYLMMGGSGMNGTGNSGGNGDMRKMGMLSGSGGGLTPPPRSISPSGIKSPQTIMGNIGMNGGIGGGSLSGGMGGGPIMGNSSGLSGGGVSVGGIGGIMPGAKPRGRHRSEQEDQSKYTLSVDVIRLGMEARTTLMIKNIPNKYSQKMLLAAVDENHKGRYDFFYLPIDFKNKCNVGYAFINFIDVYSITYFYEDFNGKRWEKFNSEKICQIAFARIQGKSALIAHFQNSLLMCEDRKCRPIIFHSDGPLLGEQERFPVSSAVRQRRKEGTTPTSTTPTTTSPTTTITTTSPGGSNNSASGEQMMQQHHQQQQLLYHHAQQQQYMQSGGVSKSVLGGHPVNTGAISEGLTSFHFSS